jgi:hypothetical protein
MAEGGSETTSFDRFWKCVETVGGRNADYMGNMCVRGTVEWPEMDEESEEENDEDSDSECSEREKELRAALTEADMFSIWLKEPCFHFDLLSKDVYMN